MSSRKLREIAFPPIGLCDESLAGEGRPAYLAACGLQCFLCGHFYTRAAPGLSWLPTFQRVSETVHCEENFAKVMLSCNQLAPRVDSPFD